MTEKDCLLWLLSIDGMRGKNAFKALQYFKSAKNVRALFEEADNRVITSKNKDRMRKSKMSFDINAYKRTMERLNMQFISIFDEDFPEYLKHIPQPPLGLYVRGNIENFSHVKESTSISIVGSRTRSAYGEEVARKLAFDLSQLGFTIVSGMAKGLDSYAHKGAFMAGGDTIGVLGNGLDICYPKKNRDVFDELCKNGLLISEYPIGKSPTRYAFPERNRIISGLSKGIIVIEAGLKSGTNITVDHALDQGKEVFAVPGSIYSPYSKGTNKLIDEGAHPALDAEQIANILGHKKLKQAPIVSKFKQEEKKFEKDIKDSKDKYAIKVKNLAEDERLVYNCVSLEGVTVDKLVNLTNLPIQKLLSVLLQLELGGFIKKLPGQQYTKEL